MKGQVFGFKHGWSAGPPDHVQDLTEYDFISFCVGHTQLDVFIENGKLTVRTHTLGHVLAVYPRVANVVQIDGVR